MPRSSNKRKDGTTKAGEGRKTQKGNGLKMTAYRKKVKQELRTKSSKQVLQEKSATVAKLLRNVAGPLTAVSKMTDAQMSAVPGLTDVANAITKDIDDLGPRAGELRKKLEKLIKSGEFESEEVEQMGASDAILSLSEEYMIWLLEYNNLIVPALKDLAKMLQRLARHEDKLAKNQTEETS